MDDAGHNHVDSLITVYHDSTTTKIHHYDCVGDILLILNRASNRPPCPPLQQLYVGP